MDKRFAVRLGLIFLLILGGVLLLKKQQSQTAKIQQTQEEQELVAKIPDIEKEIKQLEELQEKKIIAEAIDFRGILISEQERYAVIGDGVYREGDAFGEYLLSKISVNFIVVEHKSTQKRDILYLP